MERPIYFFDGLAGRYFPQRQTGGGLLIILLLITGAAASLFVHNLSAGLILASREHRTALALRQAREALIGYAISYPDTINPDYGPGYLPCPDRNNDGATDAGACSLSGHTSIGRLPYKTLELERLRDGGGETLWYVVADNFRNNPKLEPLNSDTAGNLSVDALNDIAAIVLASGSPLLSQNRSAEPNNIANYLELENADFDALFVTNTGNNTNDTLVFITRDELMRAVERRVLGELSRQLKQYQISYHAFPWLSPYANPSISAFRAQLDAATTPKKGWQGHIAFHLFSWATKPSKTSGTNPFTTDITWTWAGIANAVVNSSGTVDASCIASLNCATGPFQNIVALANLAPVSCVWSDKESVDCAGTSVELTASYAYPLASGCADGTLTRTYTINFPPYRGVTSVHDPAAAAYRTRSVELNGALPDRTNAVLITDVYNGPISEICDHGSVTLGAARMDFTSDTIGMIRAENIHYDLDVKAGEMPEWFFKNDWHTMVYVAYSGVESLPGAPGGVCSPADNCLVLNGAGSPLDKNRALALIAGRALSGVLRPAAQLSAYFESANATADEIFSQGITTTAFNDQTKVIATP